MTGNVVRNINRSKRVTKQIRVVIGLHEKLSELSKRKNLTLSKTIEKICLRYFYHEIK